MQSVNLESASSPSGFRDFIAVGTGFDFAEDRATRGNVSFWLPLLANEI
jgi:cleavage and polyadenylation specificity factor subunit 1